MKIYSPNKDYTGVSASVPFCSGVGETEDPHLIEWFKDHGYKVGEEPAEEPAEETCAEETCAEGKTVKNAKAAEKNAKAST